MDNPACSTVDIPSIHKTDHSTTSLFDDAELELQCYHNRGVIVDDEEQKDPHLNTMGLPNVYNEVLLNVLNSSSSWKSKHKSDDMVIENEDNENEVEENEENDNEDESNDCLKIEENSRVSDGDSCNSNASSRLTFTDHYIKVGFFKLNCILIL